MNIEEAQRKLLQLVDDKVKLKKELEVYNKALEMACEQVHRFEVLANYGDGVLSTDKWKEYFVKKAREDNV